MFNINIADDWIQTMDLWYRKQLLYQLSHYHCLQDPFLSFDKRLPQPQLATFLCLGIVPKYRPHKASPNYNLTK